MLSGLHVLLAEDNPTNQLVASQMLESLGASVALAEDGVEALECIERDRFDVILVDIEMPRVNGIEVIRRVRGMQGPVAETPMIALTAYVMREHRAAIDAAGADGVIAKPILSIEQFGADIRRFMRDRARTASSAVAGSAAGAGGSDAAASDVDRDLFDHLAQSIGPAATAELLEKVESDLRSTRARLVKALDPINVDEIRAVTHIVVSVSGAVGALALSQQAGRVNAAAHGNDASDLSAGVRGLLGMIDQVLDFVSSQAVT